MAAYSARAVSQLAAQQDPRDQRKRTQTVDRRAEDGDASEAEDQIRRERAAPHATTAGIVVGIDGHRRPDPRMAPRGEQEAAGPTRPPGLTRKCRCDSVLQWYPAVSRPAPVGFIPRAKMNRILLEGVLSVARVATWATLFCMGRSAAAAEAG